MYKKISMAIMDFEKETSNFLEDVPFSTAKFYLQIVSDFLTDSNNPKLCHIDSVLVETKRKSTTYEINYDNMNYVIIVIEH